MIFFFLKGNYILKFEHLWRAVGTEICVYADETLTTVVSALIIHKKIKVKPENCWKW